MKVFFIRLPLVLTLGKLAYHKRFFSKLFFSPDVVILVYDLFVFYMVLFVIVCKTNYRANVTLNQDR